MLNAARSGLRLFEKKTVWTSIPRQPITSVSPRLNLQMPISTNMKLIDMVPFTEGRLTFIPDAIRAMIA